IRAAFSDVLLTNVTFSNNVGEGNNAGTGAPNGGGALYARTGSFVDIVGGLFEQNNVGGGIGVGGGLVGSDSDVNIDGTVFRLNRGEDGGGVLWSGGVATLTNTVFDGNEAGSTGGGVRAEAGAELFISDSSFTGNSADFGGAIYGRGTVWVTNVSVLGNEAGVNGGGLRWFPDGFDGSTLLVEDSVFQDNIAGDIGGGIASASTGGVQGEIEVLDSNFTRNFALRGGGLSTENNNGLVVQRNIFCGNSGTNSSGAARVLGSALNGQLWTNNVFVENTSIGFGGGIFMSDSGDAEIINNTFLANDAPDGGNLYTELTTVDVYNNIIAFAPDGGGYSADSNGGERNYNLWFSNTPSDATGNLVPGDLGSDAVFADPMLSLYQADGLCGNDAFTPAVGSPAIDAGTPGPLDLDGSPIDIGAYGGQSADPGILLDDDGDGFTAASDCDDNDAGVFPGAAEVCDGIDNDCDGDIDGALAPGATDWYPDYDGDGFGSEADIITACDPPADYIATGGDCNDRVDTINPSAAEICDDLDNDCNDLIDDGLTTTYYYDQDADGYGDPNNAFDVCDAPPENTTTEPGDCDDVNPDINPGMEEICDGIDNDCNGDADTELYATWYRDADGDEFGYDDNTRDECEQPQGYVEVGGDCNDANANINPAAIDENIDTVDQDCDGTDGQPYSAEALLARSECGCSATENPMGGWWAMLGIMSLLARRRRDR
ncbi:MAG: hypothetical protein GWP91_21850, partial [Rhodobacterales bacterium]|nr:hypothetical protein [Rhodobacterales bacterium]